MRYGARDFIAMTGRLIMPSVRLAVIAYIDGCRRFELIAGFCGNKIDHACRDITTIKRILWTAQHLNLADVEEFLLEEMVADEWRVVEGDRHGRIGRHGNRLRTDAAYLDAVAGEIRLRERHVRNLFDQV